MISEENEMQLCDELRRDEGVRYSPYNDSRGFMTIGVGHNMQASPLPDGWVYPLDDGQVDALLESDLMSVYSDLDSALPWWENLNDVRQRAMCNFVFQLGITKALAFKNSLPLIRQGQYALAADNMMQSAWAQQTPNRAKRVTDQIRFGV